MRKLAIVIAVVSLLAMAQTTALSDQYQSHYPNLNYSTEGLLLIPFDFSQSFQTVSRVDVRLQAYVSTYIEITEFGTWENEQYITHYNMRSIPSRMIARIADMEWYWDYESSDFVTWEHSIDVPTQSLQESLRDGTGVLALSLTWIYNEPGPYITNGWLPSMGVKDLLVSVDASPEPVCEPASEMVLVSGLGGCVVVAGRRRFWH